ncbi:MAG TPA: TSUP family transporter [Herpetosiphonaceae bacterium]|nr:TSUP family transporter [Herpetosiphonaceae bacterium]
MTLVWLCLFAALAGFIDSVGGGGGLVQLPALFVLRGDVAQTAPALLLGTNKMASVTGTTAAAVTYNRRVAIDWRLVWPAMITAAIFSALGARAATLVSPAVFRPLVLALLIGVAIYTFRRKTFGTEARITPASARPLPYVLAIGAGIGFYDGFFGPGTGSFLIFLFVGVLGLDFLHASASAKIINVTTNIAALIYFAWSSNILYAVALPMSVCNILGGLLGARMAIRHGSRFVRAVFLVVVIGVIARYAYEIGWA